MMRVLAAAAMLALSSCATVGPDAAAGPRTKAANGMEFTHERLGASRHFLTVYDTRQGMGWAADSYQSMTMFAHRWAARTFPRGYEVDEGTADIIGRRQPFTIPSKSFIITETR